MNASTDIDLRSPRSIGQIVDLAVIAHRRQPLLLLTLALSVVAPYVLIVVAVSGGTPLGQSHVSDETIFLLEIISFALVTPLISVLHIHALTQLGEGTTPTLATVYRPALRVLPVAAAAQIITGIGVFAGLTLFVIPGVFVLVRLAVVAQVAAIERTDWIGALRGSVLLTLGNAWHTLGVVVVAAVVELALVLGGEAVAGTHTGPLQVILAIVVATVGQSFSAIVAAILYYDLRARRA
jgi:hypothetical protein